jgi:ribonuclease-3
MDDLPPARLRDLMRWFSRCGFPAVETVDWIVLDRALTHPSLDPVNHNDRLEFLGDAVLRLLVGQFLYSTYPNLSVGQLSVLRADLLSNAFFYQLAEGWGFERVLAIGGSARHDRNGRRKRLADAFEAVVGALYLSWQSSAPDRCLFYLQVGLEPYLRDRAERLLQDWERHNAKTVLQELTQGRFGELPSYRLIDGEQYSAHFTVEVWANGSCWGKGTGRSKKAAEIAAAQQAYDRLSETDEHLPNLLLREPPTSS